MSTEKFINLLSKDKLGTYTSFTRNINYDYVVGRDIEYTVQIKVDGDKLSNNYKITPVNDGHGWVADEYEEYVNKTIKNIGKYITEIIIIKLKTNYSYTYRTKHNETISEPLTYFLKKYPHIKLKVKLGYSGKIVPHERELDWLKDNNIFNKSNKKIIDDDIQGVYRNNKLLFNFTTHTELCDNILKKYDKLFKFKYGIDFDHNTENYEILSLNQTDEYMIEYIGEEILPDIVTDPIEFVTDDINKCVVIKQNKDSSITIQYQKENNINIDYYIKLVSKYTDNYKIIDPSDYYKQYQDWNAE